MKDSVTVAVAAGLLFAVASDPATAKICPRGQNQEKLCEQCEKGTVPAGGDTETEALTCVTVCSFGESPDRGRQATRLGFASRDEMQKADQFDVVMAYMRLYFPNAERVSLQPDATKLSWICKALFVDIEAPYEAVTGAEFGGSNAQ